MEKTAVITGGTKGIGRSLVFAFAKQGFKIITNSRSNEELIKLQQEVKNITGSDLLIKKSDFSQKEEVSEFAEFIKQNFNHLNLLINNAGIFIPGSIINEEDWVYEKEMAINLDAPYHLIRKLFPLIENGGDSYIFNMCSTASFTAHSNGGSYSISKFGLLGLTKVLRQELKEKGIAVSAIMPGPTYTNSWAGSDIEKERFMQPDDIAEFIVTAWNNRKYTVLEEIVLRPILGDI